MPLKLDLRDHKILYELDKNSRQPLSEIAKKVGTSKQVVGFRIKRLLKEEIIQTLYSVIDVSKLGFTVHKSFLRLQNLDREKQKALIKFLVNHPNIVWVASCDGRFDLAFGAWAKDMAFLDNTLTELNKKFGEHIAEREIATIIRGEYFIRGYLINKKEPRQYTESSFGAVPIPIKLDRIDWEILNTLSINSRATAVELSNKVKLSADAVSERIKKLESAEILKHYNIVPNESLYPYLHYKVLVGFRNISEEREKMLKDYCHMTPNIIYIVKSLGPWELEIDLEVENAQQFREIMMDLKTKFNDILKDYSTLQIYQVHKYNFCPSIPN